MDEDEDDWIVTNFFADDELVFAQRLLARGHEGESTDGQERARKRRVVHREVAEGHENLIRDYLGMSATYTNESFERRFLIPRDLFDRIVGVFATRGILGQQFDATGKAGPTREQKMLCALRALQTGAPTDVMDDYFRMGDSTARQALKDFCESVDEVFGNHFLRWPTVEDLKRLYDQNARRGFPGLLGSLDCTHWAWRACRRAHAGVHKGKEKRPTVIIEAVAGEDTRIWHLFVGTPGACNDLNVLDRSPLLNHFMNSADPVNQVQYTIDGQKRTTGYMLGDGIYPEYAIFANPISQTANVKAEHYNKRQSAVRKDVERAFGVMKGRFGILRQPSRLHRIEDLIRVARACTILHNMRIDFQTNRFCIDEMVFHTPYTGVSAR